MALASRTLICAVFLIASGCGPNAPENKLRKLPRPVSALILTETDPDNTDRRTGVAASWKMEDIGFEVSGRLQYVVVEPESEIQGDVYDVNRELIVSGTLLAKLDDARYVRAVNSAKAHVNVALRQKEAAQIEIEKVLPAQMRAAKAELKLAATEFTRSERLVKKQAGAQAELDRAQADLESAQAKIAQLEATLESKAAQLSSLEAQVVQAQESLAQADQDLQDCNLVSAFRGQVVNVHQIPGASVQRGQPVLTVQMMDPIKIDVEVSASMSRKLNHRDVVDVFISQDDDDIVQRRAFVYTIDPTADPLTRTFTVTLLLENEQIETAVPKEMQGRPVVRTQYVWAIYSPPESSRQTYGDRYFIETNSIHKDDRGHFIWKVTNRRRNVTTNWSPILRVKKVRVAAGKLQVPLLGIWTFRAITVRDGEDFDPQTDLAAGQLILPSDVQEPWDGDTLLLADKRWLLRPGDVVGVELASGDSKPGFYVPMDAILEMSEANYVYVVVEEGPGLMQAQRVEVEVESLGNARSLRRIESEQLDPGMRIIAAGAHYIQDGDSITVVEEVEQRQ